MKSLYLAPPALYIGCAVVGIPCPISGNPGAIGKEAAAPEPMKG